MTVGSQRALGSRYELIDLIGSGAMGQVWRALDRTTDRHVAAKLLRSEYVSDPQILTRFLQERSILMNLRHPSIVEVHDLVVEGDALAIVMELIDGPNLGAHLKQVGTLAPAVAVGVAVAVLDGLAEAHDKSALHRDVKPDNVMLASTTDLRGANVKLTDFSIARLAQESTVQATGLLGTPSYMPPELFEKGQFSTASDVYATGILLYELLAGRTPFAGAGTAHTVGFRHLTAVPPPLPVPERLAAVLDIMLAKDPRRRLTAAATATALRELAPELETLPALPVQPEPASWRTVPAPGAVVTGPIHVATDAIDPGATNLHADFRAAPEAMATTGAVQAVVPLAPIAGEEVTHLGGPVHEAVAPTLVTHRPPVRVGRRRPWLIGAGALAAVVVVLAVLLVTGVLGGSSKTDHATAAPTSVTARDAGLDDTPTGFTESASATYDPASDAVSVELTYGLASRLNGPILLVLPAIGAGDGCASPSSWSGEVTAETSLASQSAADPVECGWSLTPAAGRTTAAITTHIPVTAAVTEDGLQHWLDSIDTRTATALKGVSGTAFAAQRLTGIEVETLTPATRLGFDKRVPFAIYPIWTGSSKPSRTDALFATAADGSYQGDPSSAWQAVTGSKDLGGFVTDARGVTLSDGEVVTGNVQGEAGFTIKIDNQIQASLDGLTVSGPAS